MTSILALFVLLLGGGLFVGYQYVHGQYYVGSRNGKIVIFQGLDQQLLGVSLFSPYRYTGIPLTGIPDQDAQAVRRASGLSLTQVSSLVANIRKDYQDCQNAYAAVRHWAAGKPKPVTRRIRVNGKIVTRKVTPHYRPKPPIPAGCPPQPSSGP